ncbi:MAG TPA: hypothetical protein ENG69_05385 [Candidatus Korarchaeota archaeon]|nr:hypothetical protein [Candidatus Korarchaeota archaeon]
MSEGSEDVTIRVYTYLNRTEDPLKILMAIRNVIPVSEEDEVLESSARYVKWPRLVIYETQGLDKLLKLRNAFRSNRVLDTARMLLKASARGTTMELLLHKQAALKGHIVLCESNDESPLGVIRVEITLPPHMFGRMNLFLDWMAPKTSRGKIVKEVRYGELASALKSSETTTTGRQS